ncbi:polysaccharide deacetylase family protein [Pedobacter heparinus]|uniref:polysaccharide deacetylase family protein n=1 Tax=Pedobacter heparinus TaxID=984 RepID=UPI00293060E7|nr:polysaccharide deacetylase family protein [Pedobacter heparinus]
MTKPIRHIRILRYCLLFACCTAFVQEAAGQNQSFVESHGAIVRGNPASNKLALVFTGDEYGDGAAFIANALKKEQVHASFFLTGNFYRNKHFKKVIGQLKQDGNYLGSHSDKHLLYCDWGKRDSLLVTRAQFEKDINNSYAELKRFGIDKKQAAYFLPPYEWYNHAIAAWTYDMGLQLVNFTPGTRSAADYTYPEMGTKYVDSEKVLTSILSYEQKDKNGLNGFMLLVHIGTDPRRKDKFYTRLPELIQALKGKGYQFVRVDELLGAL